MSFWGNVLQGVVAVPALAAGVVHGTYNVLTGEGDFLDGLETTEDWMTAAEEYGDEHDKEMTEACKHAAVHAIYKGIFK